MNWLPDLAALSVLARRRYPYTPAPLALLHFLSDRREAGMGAMRSHYYQNGVIYPRLVTNTKRLSMRGDAVQYDLSVSRPRESRLPEELPQLPINGNHPAELVATIITRPDETARAVCVRIESSVFDTQKGRDHIAGMLRKARRELRTTLINGG